MAVMLRCVGLSCVGLRYVEAVELSYVLLS